MSDKKVEAILLVGGRGTRLAPLTDAIAKPMLPVGGVPFIAHQIAQAQAAGINKIVLATSYLAQTFTDYFGDGSDFGVELIYAVEENALGTGDYTTVAGFPLWNPDEGKYVYKKVMDNTTSYGGNLETARDMMMEQFNQYKEFNKQLFNGDY